MKKLGSILITLLLGLALAACSLSPAQVASAPAPAQGSAAVENAASPIVATAPASGAEALADNDAVHAEAADYVLDSQAATTIQLLGDTLAVAGPGVTIAGSTATITAAGTYQISGTLADGQVIVNTPSEETVHVILAGASLSSAASSAPLYVQQAGKVVILLAEGTENTVASAVEPVAGAEAEDGPNAALFSTADLTIYGDGALTVTAGASDGITSKDGLVIAGGQITVAAADDGIRGKDYLVVQAGTLAVTAGGNGLLADNDTDAGRGYIAIEAGAVNVTAGSDALQAATDVVVTDGALVLAAGGGSRDVGSTGVSAKGIKAGVSLNIDGGTFTVDSADDALHANGTVAVNGGVFSLATGDDGIHADTSLTINGGDLTIGRSYEGLESSLITLNAGNIHVVSSDDGLNVASGNDGSGFGPGGGRGPRQDTFTYSGSQYLYINGGYVAIEAAGDGLDINGAIVMTGGVLLVNGPVANNNGALDYDGGFTLTGGLVVAVGSAGMAQAPDSSSSQYSLLVNLDTPMAAGTLVHIETSQGEEVLTFVPTKAYQSVAFSSPALADGGSYTLSVGGASTGAAADSLYQGGAYTGGTLAASFTVSSVVTRVGSARSR